MADKRNEYDAQMAQYNAWADKMNAKSRKWDATRRAEYESERDDLKGKIDA